MNRAPCKECSYLRNDRAAIHQYDGHATREEAERMAKDIRCDEHKPKPIQPELI